MLYDRVGNVDSAVPIEGFGDTCLEIYLIRSAAVALSRLG
jgi:hypothetical protein